MSWWPSWLVRVYSIKPEPRYHANFSTSLRIVRRLSNESGKWLNSCWVWCAFCLLVSTLNLKDPFAEPVLQPRHVRNSGNTEKCISCSIPDPIRGQTNYMFRNGYNIWCRSRTLCSCLRRKSVYWYVTCYGRRWRQLLIVFTSSSLPFLNSMLLEQSAGILCQ